MSMRTATLWIATTVIAMFMAIVWDEPTETDAARAVAADKADAIADARIASKGRQ